jgi:SAM-dependent methyltransferase
MDRKKWYAAYWPKKAMTYSTEVQFIAEEGEHKRVLLEAIDNAVQRMRTGKNKNKKLQVLDLGCWNGNLLAILEEKYPSMLELHGVDLAERAVAFAKRRFDARVCDIEEEALPYEAGTFDIVLSANVMEHLFNLDNYFTEIRRVLRRGGLFVASTPNSGDLMSRFGMLLGRPPYWISVEQAYEHVRFIDKYTLKYFARRYVFELVDLRGDCILLNLGFTTAKIKFCRRSLAGFCSIFVMTYRKP